MTSKPMNIRNKSNVAIITRTKNRPLFLIRCIKTVLAQQYQDWIHVIVNDGGDCCSVDEIVRKNHEAYRNRIKVIHNLQSLGMEAASNIGVKNSESNYITILDDDDTWHPDFLSQCITSITSKRHPKIAGVVTHSSRVLEKVEQNGGKDIIIEIRRKPFNQYLRTISIFQLAISNIFTVNSFVFERDALKTVGLYREDLPVLGDWEFNLRFALQYEIDVIPSTLSFFHVRVKGKNEHAANSIIKNIDEHYFYKTLIHNEYLRKEILSNQGGLSTIISSHYYFEQSQSKIRFFLRRLFQWIKKHDSLAVNRYSQK